MTMSTFKSTWSYHQFEQRVRGSARYVRHPDDQTFLDTLVIQGKNNIETLQAGTALWRAQLGYVDSIDYMPQPLPPKRMIPLEDRASEGRANAKGIPVLYCATQRETAMAEVRPWIGSYISVGYFSVAREIRVINFATETIDASSSWENFLQKNGTRRYGHPLIVLSPSPHHALMTQLNMSRPKSLQKRLRTMGLTVLGTGFPSEGLGLYLTSALLTWSGCQLFNTHKLQFTFQEIAKRHYVTDQATDTVPDDPRMKRPH